MTVGKNPDHSTGGWNEFQPGTRRTPPPPRPGTRAGRGPMWTQARARTWRPGPARDPRNRRGARPRTDEEAPVAAEGPRLSPSDDEGMLGVLNGGSRDEIKLATGFDDAQIDLIVARRPIGKLLDLQSIDGVMPRQAGDLQGARSGPRSSSTRARRWRRSAISSHRGSTLCAPTRPTRTSPTTTS